MPVYLFCHPSMRGLASRIVHDCEKTVSQRGNDGSPLPHEIVNVVDDIQWDSFEDGFPNLFIKNVKKVAGNDVLFLADFSDPAKIFEQLAVIYAIPRYLARSFTLLLPYFPCATMERIDHEGQIATAMTMASLLSNIPLTQCGPARILIYDIHALQERFYFSRMVLPRLESAIPLLLKRIAKHFKPEEMAIAFPDEGACKRFKSFFSNFGEIIICHKVRQGDERIVNIKEGSATGKHVLIIDDLVKTGGTLLQCAKALKKQDAKMISAYVTHAVFPKESYKRFTPDLFNKFYFTDSCPDMAEILEHRPPFELVSLAPGISQALLSFDLVV